MDGELSIVSKCSTESFNLKTIEKLIYVSDYTGNIKSGVLEINSATYTYNDPYVTIKTALEEQIILQEEIDLTNDTIHCTE
jgi:hypothetical protein